MRLRADHQPLTLTDGFRALREMQKDGGAGVIPRRRTRSPLSLGDQPLRISGGM
jgi:hypothetical protein